MTRRAFLLLAPIAGLALLGGCGPVARHDPSPTRPAVHAAVVEVHRSPSCTCCREWEAYLVAHGFVVTSVTTADMGPIKADAGVPEDAWSCHTAEVDGYVVEGHVPVEAIEDLLTLRPAVDGISLPGMPPGSPGMPGEKGGTFQVLAFVDGQTSLFGSY